MKNINPFIIKNFILIAIAIMYCYPVFSQDCSKRELCSINENIIDYIKIHFKEYRIADTSDFVNDWCAFYQEKNVPYYQEGDYNGDTLTDYAVMLLSGSDFKIVVVQSEDNNKFSCFILTDEKSEGLTYPLLKGELEIGFGISPPGEFYDFDSDSTIKIETNTLDVIFFEKAAESYYWKNNKYLRIHTAD